MDLSPALAWSPPSGWQKMTTIDSHTGGEPFRVVVDGLPPIPGTTVLERRRYAIEHLDHLRKATIWEPRGHADMYGGWLGDPVDSDSDISVLFVHNEGFSTMCGHGIIALTKIVLELGILPIEAEETTIRIDTPAGQVTATATITDGVVSRVRFSNVPSFVVSLDAVVEVPNLGPVVYDLAFGGGFYAYVEASIIGQDLEDIASLVANGRRIKKAVGESTSITHPDDADLGFLYGVIFTGPPHHTENHSRNVCVFADGEIDRSPTGTGVSGRLALLYARGEIGLGDQLTIEAITGSEFVGQVVEVTRVGDVPAIVPEVAGEAHLLGRSEYWFDPSDRTGQGFLLRATIESPR